MLHRRAMLACLPMLLAAPRHGRAQAPRRVRYTEVVRSLFFAPAYVAIGRGLFRDAGLEVEMTTANGGDRVLAAMVGGAADIALVGPEVPVFVQSSASSAKLRIFSGLTAADGYLLVARPGTEPFAWSQLRGAEVMGWRPGSTPLLFLEAAIRQNGLDPRSDVTLVNSVAIPARMGAWLAGQTRFAIFSDPEAAQLELDGKGRVVASVGEVTGRVDYTVFTATEGFARDNPETLRAWTAAIVQAMGWVGTAPIPELAATLAPFFPGVGAAAMTAALERYRRLAIWKTTPAVAPAAFDRFQEIFVAGGALEPARRAAYADIFIGPAAARTP